MDISESATLLVREILERSGNRPIDVDQLVDVLALLHFDVPKSVVKATVMGVVERGGLLPN